MLLKIGPGAGGADEWYFYETFELQPGRPPMVAAAGAPGCVGCHVGGRDFVQSLYPDG